MQRERKTLWDKRPRSPKIDGYGLHAVDCACPRCEDGYRPTEAERARARSEHAQRAHAKASAERAKARTAIAREEGERKLREVAEAAATASPPPDGGYLAWCEEQRREAEREAIELVKRDHAQAGARHAGRQQR